MGVPMRRPARLLLLLPVLAAVVPPAAADGVARSATGSGHITVNGELRTFSFSARTMPDGTATGHAQVNSRSLDTAARLEIDCLRVVGDTAHMSGVVVHSTRPSEVAEGEYRRFVVRDAGESAGHPPDLISTIPANPTGQTCRDSTLVPNRPVEHGEVQVR